MVQSNKKDFVWIGLRVSFWVMVGIWILSPLLDLSPDGIINILVTIVWVTSGIFTFAVSIIHLIRYKQKAFAITSLVISSILILLFLIGFILGVIEGYSSEDDIEEYIDYSCQDFCTGVDKVESYNYEYNNTTESVICYCLDENDDILIRKSLPLPE